METIKLPQARPAGKARVFNLAWVLAVVGLAQYHPLPAAAQIIDTGGQSYYKNSRPLLDQPLPDILRAAPELQGLEPAPNQDELAFVLDRAGRVTEELLDALPNLVSREDVTLANPAKAPEYLAGGIANMDLPAYVALAKQGENGKDSGQRHLKFDYLILVHRQGTSVTVEEYRPGADEIEREAQNLEGGYMLTRGFASSWMHFHPMNQKGTRFRYLGQETESGRRCYVVTFAEKPGWATFTGTIVYKGMSVLILYQGIAWIDAATFRIVRLRTDLLAPRADIGLERQTTEIHFSETRLPQAASPLWVPREVVVTCIRNKQIFRNVHRYSDYRLYRVETKILPVPPDGLLPKTPN